MNFQHSEKNRSCLIFNAQYKSKATIIIIRGNKDTYFRGKKSGK